MKKAIRRVRYFLTRLWFWDRNRLLRLAVKELQKAVAQRRDIWSKMTPETRRRYLKSGRDPVMACLQDVQQILDEIGGAR